MSSTDEYSSTSSIEDNEDNVRVTRHTSEADRFEILLKKIEALSKGQKKMRKKLKKLDSIEDKVSSLRTDHDALAQRVTTTETDIINVKRDVDEINKVKNEYKSLSKTHKFRRWQISTIACGSISLCEMLNKILQMHGKQKLNQSKKFVIY